MSGSFVFGCAVTFLLWVAALMNLAVIRDKSLRESEMTTSCRWVSVAGIAGLALRFSYLLYDGHFAVPWHSLMSIGMLALGLVGIGLDRLKANLWLNTQPSEPVPLDEWKEG